MNLQTNADCVRMRSGTSNSQVKKPSCANTLRSATGQLWTLIDKATLSGKRVHYQLLQLAHTATNLDTAIEATVLTQYRYMGQKKENKKPFRSYWVTISQ